MTINKEDNVIVNVEQVTEISRIDSDCSLMYNKNISDRINNILLLTLSTLTVRDGVIHQNSYTYEENGNKYMVKGYGQLEPVPKMLARKLEMDKKTQGQLDLIIILASADTQGNNVKSFITVPQENEKNQNRHKYENVNALDFFIYQIHNDSACKNTKFLVIDSENTMDSIRSTVENLRYIYMNNSNMNLYVDMHGGPRTNQLLVDAIISLLKMDGIYVKDAFNVAGGGKDIPVDNALESIRMFDFVSGMNEFINYGSGKGIQRYVDQLKNINKDYRRFAECIKEISDSLVLCCVGKFEAALDELYLVIKNLENKGIKENYLDMFIENIKNDYQEDLLDKNKRTLVREIEWAQKKGFYQQCLAIIESKTPEYVFSQFIKYQDESIRIKLIEDNGIPKDINMTLQEFYRYERKDDNESEQSRISNVLLFSFRNKRDYRIEHEQIVISVTYRSKNRKKEYRIEFFTEITNRDIFEAFLIKWKELKIVRNGVMHVYDESNTVGDVDQMINVYLDHFKTLIKEINDKIYEVKITKVSKKGNTWVKFLKVKDARHYVDVIKSNLPGDGFLSGQDYGNIGDILRVKVAEDDPQIRFEIAGE